MSEVTRAELQGLATGPFKESANPVVIELQDAVKKLAQAALEGVPLDAIQGTSLVQGEEARFEVPAEVIEGAIERIAAGLRAEVEKLNAEQLADERKRVAGLIHQAFKIYMTTTEPNAELERWANGEAPAGDLMRGIGGGTASAGPGVPLMDARADGADTQVTG